MTDNDARRIAIGALCIVGERLIKGAENGEPIVLGNVALKTTDVARIVFAMKAEVKKLRAIYPNDPIVGLDS